MAKYSDVVQDRNGNAVSGASVTVYLTETVTPATLTADNGDPLTNPVTTDADGVFEFNVVAGTYDLVVSKTGIVEKTQTGLVIADALALGRHTIWIPANSMTPATTDGAASAVYESTVNKNNLRCLDFDAATVQYAHFQIQMPTSWDEAAVTAKFVWKHPAAVTNFGVSWGIQAVSMSSGDTFDAAFSSAVYVNTTGGTADDVFITAETASVLPAGTPAAGDLVEFRVLRKADDVVNDTLAVTAHLIGVSLFYNVSEPTDA